MVRPRYSDASTDAIKMLEKAHFLLQKAEKLQMVEHDGKKVPHFAADGKGHKDEKKKADMAEKDKYCMKRFGKKYSDCSEKQKAECDRNVNKVEKASMAEKDKYCMKNFGKKYSECTAAQKAQCDKAHGKVEKGEHHKLQTFDSRPGGVQFMSESGGQTYNAYYTTNQSLFESDDVANKGATSISFDLEALRAKMNTHENPVEGHLTEG